MSVYIKKYIMKSTIFLIFIVISNISFSQDTLSGVKLSELFFDIPLDSSIIYWIKKINTDSNLIKVSDETNYYKGYFEKHKYIKYLGWSNYVSIFNTSLSEITNDFSEDDTVKCLLIRMRYSENHSEDCLEQFKIFEYYFKSLFDSYEFYSNFQEDNAIYVFTFFYNKKQFPKLKLMLSFAKWKEYMFSCAMTILFYEN